MCQRSVQQRGTVLVTQLRPLLRTSVYPCLRVVYSVLGGGPDEGHMSRDFQYLDACSFIRAYMQPFLRVEADAFKSFFINFKTAQGFFWGGSVTTKLFFIFTITTLHLASSRHPQSSDQLGLPLFVLLF